MFSCIAYAKQEKPILRKLDDISRRLIHLGTEPGSKAYRLYDPQSRKVTVSRDVVFDETRGWNWSKDSQQQDEREEFTIAIGTFGNHGINGESGFVRRINGGDRSSETERRNCNRADSTARIEPDSVDRRGEIDSHGETESIDRTEEVHDVDGSETETENAEGDDMRDDN